MLLVYILLYHMFYCYFRMYFFYLLKKKISELQNHLRKVLQEVFQRQHCYHER